MLSEDLRDQRQDIPFVFIDDAHTLGGTQTALARTIEVVLSRTNIPILCICTARTRAFVESIIGMHPRLRFEDAPRALPLNLFAFPLRLPAFWFLLRRIRRQGVRAWWLNLADIEFGLAPLLVLRAIGEETHDYLHGTSPFLFFHRSASGRRRLLSRIRDAVANAFVFRIHSHIIVPSRSSQEEVELRITSRKRPRIDYLYLPNSSTPLPSPFHAAVPSESALLRLWMIGNVVQGHKNNLASLDVLEQLTREGHAATLTVAGVGPDLLSFQEEAGRRGLSDRITYLGWVTDPCTVAPKDAIVFIPSFHETMNLVAREAMRQGLRLVVSPIPVFHEWIPPALIAEDFSAAAFVARILSVSRESAEHIQQMYESALDRFSVETFLNRFLELSASFSHDA